MECSAYIMFVFHEATALKNAVKESVGDQKERGYFQTGI